MTFSNVKVGDKVWSFSNGWGVVERTGESSIYTLRVRYNEVYTVLYTEDGKMYNSDMYPTLFWDEVVFEVPIKPLPKLEVDTKVVVWNRDSPSVKYKRYFSHFDEKGCLNVFSNGATSFSADYGFSTTNVWTEYEVVE